MDRPAGNSQANLIRRYCECIAFVLVWMAAEHYLHLRPFTSQLLGIPYIVFFQLVVARRPLAQLWARDSLSFRIDRGTLLIAAGLAIASAILLWLTTRSPTPGLDGGQLQLFYLVLAATLPAAFAIRRQKALPLRGALPTMVAAMVFRVVWHVTWQVDGGVVISPAANLLAFFTLWLCEFAGMMLVDEVAFRGALDPHLERAGTGRLHAWSSAVFISILWSVWHLPAYNPEAKSFFELFTHIIPFYLGVVILGVLLSFCARKARTLVPVCVMHAFGNAYAIALAG